MGKGQLFGSWEGLVRTGSKAKLLKTRTFSPRLVLPPGPCVCLRQKTQGHSLHCSGSSRKSPIQPLGQLGFSFYEFAFKLSPTLNPASIVPKLMLNQAFLNARSRLGSFL